MLKRYFVHGVPVRELRGSRLVADVLDQDVVRTIRSFVGDSSELVAVASRSIVHLHTVGGGGDFNFQAVGGIMASQAEMLI